jgi:cytochrome c-type biogenesis protein CcmE
VGAAREPAVTVTGAPRGVRSRWRLLVVAAVVVGGTCILAMTGLEGTTVYYLTPTELVARHPAPSEQLRLGGQVKPGSLHDDAGQIRFVLTDGPTDVAVRSTTTLPRIFREGEGAVVDGTLGDDGVFHADQVVVKHSNEYRAPGDGS